MFRSLLVLAATTVCVPVAAQEFTPINPADFSRPMVMHSTIDAQARSAKARRGGGSSATRARQTCADIPQFRARLGAGDARVQRLERMCRQAGYN